MNIKKLKDAESNFFEIYPEGFNDPEMLKIGKKHKASKMTQFVRSSFQEDKFNNTEEIIANMIKTVSRSSLVSVFEKPKFKDFVLLLSPDKKEDLATSLKEILYGNEEKGFNNMLEILLEGKLAKWPLMTVYQLYFKPEYDVFIKPTTCKNVLKHFEIFHLVYKPRPSYEFYKAYRQVINDMKTNVSKSLSPDNAAFSGFLMLTMTK